MFFDLCTLPILANQLQFIGCPPHDIARRKDQSRLAAVTLIASNLFLFKNNLFYVLVVYLTK